MKILDYITLMGALGKKFPSELNRFVSDLDADVFPVERDGILVIFETDKIGIKLRTNDKYDIYAIGDLTKGHVASSNNKEELIQFYIHLLQNGKVDLHCTSSNLTSRLEEEFEKNYCKNDDLTID